MKKIVSIFTVLMIATPAMADVTPNLNVATTSFVQGAVATKQDVIDASHKLSADLVDDSATTNKFVTASDKTTWNAKQAQLVNNDAQNPASVSNTVKTSVAAASSASDTSLVTEKAVATAIETATTGVVTTSGTQTLTNKTIDADDNTISDLTTSNFKAGTVIDSTTGIAAYNSASDTYLVTEKAVAKATTVTVTGSTQYGAITDVSNANGGIQVTKGDAKVQIKSSGSVTGSATMWIE